MIETATVREPVYAAVWPEIELRLPQTAAPEPRLAEPVVRPVRERTSLPVPAPQGFIQIALPLPARPAPPAAPAVTLPVAPCALRLRAGLIDAGCIAGSSLLFAVGAWLGMGGQFPAMSWRALLPALAGVPMALAAVYTLAAFHAGTVTPGMAWARLEVRTATGPASATQRRRRAWLSILSLAALGLGYGWVLCDSQGLSWHDAIAGTCVGSAAAEATTVPAQNA